MIPVTIRKEIWIEAPVEQVWQYVGTEDGLRRWWQTEIALEEKPGGRCEERSRVHGQPMIQQGVVTTYAPPHQLGISWRTKDVVNGLPGYATLLISLVANGEGTQVTVAHEAYGFDAAISDSGVMGHGQTPADIPTTLPEVQMSLYPLYTHGATVNDMEQNRFGQVQRQMILIGNGERASQWLRRQTIYWDHRLAALHDSLLQNPVQANQVQMNQIQTNSHREIPISNANK